MPKHYRGLLTDYRAAGEAASDDIGARDEAPHGVDPAGLAEAEALTAGEGDQFARDIAEIERATAALRRAEPALECWSHVPAQASSKPRPVWLLVGVLWLSTALVTIGAVVAIAALVG